MGEMGVGGGLDGGLLKHARAPSAWSCDIIPPSSIVANTLRLALDARSPPLEVRRSQDEDGDDWVQVDIRGHPLQHFSFLLESNLGALAAPVPGAGDSSVETEKRRVELLRTRDISITSATE